MFNVGVVQCLETAMSAWGDEGSDHDEDGEGSEEAGDTHMILPVPMHTPRIQAGRQSS